MRLNAPDPASIPGMAAHLRTTPPSGAQEPAQQLADQIMRSARTLRRQWRLALEPSGLSPHQERALRLIDDLGSPRLGELAQRLRIAPRSATEVVDGLELDGLVARQPDPQDRRASCAVLTARGKKVVRAARAVRDEAVVDYLSALSQTEQGELARLLAKLDDD